jgi:hypothetical protein
MMAPFIISDLSINDKRNFLFANLIDFKRVVIDDSSNVFFRNENQDYKILKKIVNRLTS